VDWIGYMSQHSCECKSFYPCIYPLVELLLSPRKNCTFYEIQSVNQKHCLNTWKTLYARFSLLGEPWKGSNKCCIGWNKWEGKRHMWRMNSYEFKLEKRKGMECKVYVTGRMEEKDLVNVISSKFDYKLNHEWNASMQNKCGRKTTYIWNHTELYWILDVKK